jgi:hypothetical protein
MFDPSNLVIALNPKAASRLSLNGLELVTPSTPEMRKLLIAAAHLNGVFERLAAGMVWKHPPMEVYTVYATKLRELAQALDKLNGEGQAALRSSQRPFQKSPQKPGPSVKASAAVSPAPQAASLGEAQGASQGSPEAHGAPQEASADPRAAKKGKAQGKATPETPAEVEVLR